MMDEPTTGRPSLYRHKDRLRAVKAYLNADGWRRFEKVREHLAKYHPEMKRISDGDVVQFLLDVVRLRP